MCQGCCATDIHYISESLSTFRQKIAVSVESAGKLDN